MRYACSKCGTVYDLSSEHIGQKLECQCGEKFSVNAPAPVFSVNKKESAALFPIVSMIIASVLSFLSLCLGIFFLSVYLTEKQAYVCLSLSNLSFEVFFVSVIIIFLSYIAAKVGKIAER